MKSLGVGVTVGADGRDIPCLAWTGFVGGVRVTGISCDWAKP